MKSIIRLSLLLLASPLQQFGSAFQAAHHNSLMAMRSSTKLLMAASYDQVAEVGYGVSVQKPMAVVFGENADPYFGLCVDDVSEGLNGGRAGLRVGDQLLAVNGEVVVGKDFDSIMGFLQDAPSSLDLVMYRGPVTSLYTILSNQLDEGESVREDDDEGDEPVIMDENYESPVRIEVKERKPLTPGDFFKAIGKVGKMLTEDDGEKKAVDTKKKSGFFGLGGEAIQLDGDDANTLK
jgi:hypothetical protein